MGGEDALGSPADVKLLLVGFCPGSGWGARSWSSAGGAASPTCSAPSRSEPGQ
jgi:hypothetical protein